MTKHRDRLPNRKTANSRWQIIVVVGVLTLAVLVLVLKASKPSASASVAAPPTAWLATPVAEAVSAVADADTPFDAAAAADTSSPAGAAALVAADGELPQDHLERMLDGGVPTFVFFHSTTCAQCIEMTEIVDQVYPDFASQVALVDVNVYDDRNQLLLKAAGIRVIPTLVFFDGAGEAQGSTGVMPAEQFRAVLSDMAAGTSDEP